MPPTPFSNTDDSEGATISGSDGDGVFKNATNGSTTVGGVTPLTTNTGGGIVRIDTSSAEVGINANPARALHVFESTDTEVAVEFKDTTGTATLKCRNDYRFDNGSGELVRITATGLVGINEVNPGCKLQVTTSSSATPPVGLAPTQATSATSGVRCTRIGCGRGPASPPPQTNR